MTMAPRKAEGSHKIGRFSVSAVPLFGDGDANGIESRSESHSSFAKIEPGCSKVSFNSTAVPPVDSSSGQQLSERARLESLNKLHEFFEVQHNLFKETWEEMRGQVYNALLQSGPQPPTQNTQASGQVSRPSTPNSAYSTSSSTSRMMPGNGGNSGSTRPSKGGGATSSSSRPSGASQAHCYGVNAREHTLQMWSSLGSTLTAVVQRNAQLEEDNRSLRGDIQTLQQRISSLQLCLSHRGTPPTSPRLSPAECSTPCAGSMPAQPVPETRALRPPTPTAGLPPRLPAAAPEPTKLVRPRTPTQADASRVPDPLPASVRGTSDLSASLLSEVQQPVPTEP